MQQFWFWNNWRTADRRLFLFIFSLFLANIVYYFYNLYADNTASIPLEIETATASLRITLDTFQQSFFNQTVEADSYYVTQRYAGGLLQINYTAVYLFLGLLLVGISTIIGAISTFSKWWYLGAMTFIIAFFAYLRLDTLLIFGLDNAIPLAAVLTVYIGVSYYFHAFATQINLYQRIAVLFLITLVLGAIILYGATVPNPALYLAGYGIVVPIIFTLVFIALVAFDIPAVLFVVMTDSKSEGKRNNMLNFTLFMVLYLVNLLLVHLRNRMVWSIDIVYVNVFWLLAVSAIVGLWHFNKKENLYRGMMPFSSVGATFFVSLALIAFATMNYAFASSNDPLIEVFEDAILYSHLCFGFGFLIYVFVNFSEIMNKNVKTHKVMYEPRYMSVLALQSVGLTGVVIFVLSAGKFQYYQSIAAYYNGVADVYYAQKDMLLAQKFYEEAISYEFQNHHSNYAMASIYAQGNDPIRAAAYYKQALRKKPSEQTYLGLSNYYLNTEQLVEGLMTLREGVNRFPESDVLYNNMALAYMDTKFADSALYCFERAQTLSPSKREAVPETNLLAFALRRNLVKDSDSIAFLPKHDGYLPYQTNRLALLSLQQKPNTLPLDTAQIPDSTLTELQFCYLNNAALNGKFSLDTSVVPYLQKLRVQPKNSDYSNQLKLVQAISYYYSGYCMKGYDLLTQLDLSPKDEATPYTEMRAKWLSQQQVWPLASKAFFRLLDYNNAVSLTNYAAALSENNQTELALPYWERLAANNNDTANTETARMMFKALKANNLQEMLALNEDTRLLVLHYRKTQLTESLRQQLLGSFENPNFKVLAACELADFYAANNDSMALVEVLQTAQLHAPKAYESSRNEYHFRDLRWRQAPYANAQALLVALENEPLNPWHKAWLPYFAATAALRNNDETKALFLLQTAMNLAPFQTEIILATTQLLYKQGKTQQAYDLLVNTLNTNPNDHAVRQEYVLCCFKLNLDMLTDDEIARLEKVLSAQELSAFRQKVETLKSELAHKKVE